MNLKVMSIPTVTGFHGLLCNDKVRLMPCSRRDNKGALVVESSKTIFQMVHADS